jgi:divalent metal cation (Fe/Co/Zn/Cd) transporter
MSELSTSTACDRTHRAVLWLQGITLVWMLAECGIALYAAINAHSVALLGFGTDSLVELLSATVVLGSVIPAFRLSRERAAGWAGVLLYGLAGVILCTAIGALVARLQSAVSPAGLGITAAALIAMPALAAAKRHFGNLTHNRALTADAAQSATCAYLAAITLVSLALNAVLHIRWIDPIGALAIVPALVIEGRKTRRGEGCGCR